MVNRKDSMKGGYRELDFIDLLSMIFENRLRITMLTLAGILLSATFAFMKPNYYRTSVEVSVPGAESVAVMNQNGIRNYTQDSLFKEYLSLLKSESYFKDFVFKNGYIDKFYTNSEESVDFLFSLLANKLDFSVMEPDLQGEYVEFPKKVMMTIETTNENNAVALLNNYIAYINETLITNLASRQRQERDIILQSVRRRKETLIEAEKSKRDREIVKLKSENMYEIMRLEQQVEMLLEKAKKERKAQIYEAQKALQLALALSIEKPTTISSFDSSGGSETNITLSTDSEYPLYLMGSTFLKTYIKSLETSPIDENLVEGVSDLQASIDVLKNNIFIKELEERENASVYINTIDDLIAKELELRSYTFDFSNAEAFSLNKRGIVEKKKTKPNRILMIIIGSFFSLFLAITGVLTFSSLQARQKADSTK